MSAMLGLRHAPRPDNVVNPCWLKAVNEPSGSFDTSTIVKIYVYPPQPCTPRAGAESAAQVAQILLSECTTKTKFASSCSSRRTKSALTTLRRHR